jgi:hypothetical protein
MQMTESFATTVAAVAPVVWLVGAVEAQQLVKRRRQFLEDEQRALAEAVVDLEDASDAEVLAFRLPRFQESLKWIHIAVFSGWIAVAGCLAVTTICALAWLGMTEPRSENAGLAAFCYFSITVGMGVVTAVPALAVMVRGVSIARRLDASYAKLLDQRSAAQVRVQAAPSEPEGQASPQS